MKHKTISYIFLVFILLLGTINVDAAGVTELSLPANEPWSNEYVDKYTNAKVGTHLSIAHHPLTGAAYISYYDAVNGDLWMAREVNPGTGNCRNNNDWRCTKIDSDNDVGTFSSIDVTYKTQFGSTITKVGIAYYDATRHALKYADFVENRIPAWEISTVDAAVYINQETRGTYTSMKFDNDNVPVIGYHAFSTYPEYGAVNIARRVGSAGTGCNGGSPTWSCEIIDEVGNSDHLEHGSHVSIDTNWLNTLFVAFFNSENNSLDFAYPNTSGSGSCSNSNWNCITVDQGPGRGKYISIHAKQSLNDKMRFAYYDQAAGRIRYAESVGSGGNCTNTGFNCIWVDRVGTPIGHYGLSMTVDKQGYPIIAYMNAYEDLAPATLKIARPALAYGGGNGNCGDIPPGDLFQYWTCKTIDGGTADIDKARFVGVSVSPAGLATVAYSEHFDMAYESYLKVARQHFAIYLPQINK